MAKRVQTDADALSVANGDKWRNDLKVSSPFACEGLTTKWPGRTVVGSIARGSLAESSSRIKGGGEVVAINGINIAPLPLRSVSQMLAQRQSSGM